MTDTSQFPNYQDQPLGAIPVYLVQAGSSVSGGNPLNTTGSGGGGGGVVGTSPISFQQTLTTSAVALATNTYAVGIVITSLSTNTGTVYVGASGVTTSTGYPLVAGQSISYSVSNSNLVYIIGTNGTDKVAVTGN